MQTLSPQAMASLHAAYDAVFDFKDTQVAGGDADYAAYEALKALEKLMEATDTPVPSRRDNKVQS